MKLNLPLLLVVLALLGGCAFRGRGVPPAQNNTKKDKATQTSAQAPAQKEPANKETARTETATQSNTPPLGLPSPTAMILPPIDLITSLEENKDSMPQPQTQAKQVDPRPILVRIVQKNDLTEIRELIKMRDERLVQKDSYGRIPLHYAKSAEMVNLLWGEPVVIDEVQADKHESFYGQSQDVADKDGLYPLHTIAANGDSAAIRAFNNKWCSWWNSSYLNRVDPEGRTALHLATMNNKLNSVVELLNCSYVEADIADNEGRLPVHYAAENPNFPREGLLLLYRSAKFYQDHKDARGETPLDIVARAQSAESYALLKTLSLAK